MAVELGVSRTPLREVKGTYPILWTLECLALQTTEAVPDTDELAFCNERPYRANRDSEQALEVDLEWHAMLIAGCRNKRLRSMITELKQTIHRYEHTSMWEAALIDQSVKQHQEIIDALTKGDVRQASSAQQENGHTGMESLLERILDT